MKIFEEIDKVKKELPKINSLQKEAKKIELNFYQKFAIVT